MPTLYELVRLARRETNTWTDGDLATFLGCSRRTVQRHIHLGGLSQERHYHALIRAVHPKNPGLAAQLASARNTSLVELGLAAPAPPPDTTRPADWDSVVCAAADVLQLPPSAVRPAVAAALAKALELEVTIAGLVRQSTGGHRPPKAKEPHS